MNCKVENCELEKYCLGFCNRHYLKFKRHGDPLWQEVFKKDGPCKAPGCDRNAKTKGLCPKHYKKMRETGTLEKLKHGGPALSELSILDGIRDTRPGYRGFLAANTIDDIRHKARKRGKEWSISSVDAYKMIISRCSYCEFKPVWPESHIGIDRIDSNIGYVNGNCVPCCSRCNFAKNDMTIEEFKNHIKSMYNVLFKETI